MQTKIRPIHFVALSTLVLVAFLALHELFILREELSSLEQELTNRLSELGTVSDENEELLELLDRVVDEKHEAEERQRQVEERNRQLEDFFSSFLHTYDYAASGNGHYMDVMVPSHFSAEMLEQAWTTLGLPGMQGTGEALVQAEKETGVNAIVLAALAWHESGGGTSRIAQDKNNLYGYGAFCPNPYQYAYTFTTRDEGTIYVASRLQEDYFSRDGRYYTGTTLVHANRYYAADQQWASKLAIRMQRIVLAAVDANLLEELRGGADREGISL